MEDAGIRVERAHNLWSSFARKHQPIARATEIDPDPQLALAEIGGLAAAKEEILTYACAATDPAVYGRWGTYPPSGLLLIGRRGVGKRLLARSLDWEYSDEMLYDPIKNTEMAALYLDILFSAYNDRDMVLAEYNGGPLNAGYYRANSSRTASDTDSGSRRTAASAMAGSGSLVSEPCSTRFCRPFGKSKHRSPIKIWS